MGKLSKVRGSRIEQLYQELCIEAHKDLDKWEVCDVYQLNLSKGIDLPIYNVIMRHDF
jgi:DNA-binding protein Fis